MIKSLVSVDDFIHTIKDQGYDVSISKIVLPVKGMSCASCVANVQEALSSLPGVVSASVNFATEKATVEYFPAQAGIRDFRNVIREAGYELVEAEKGEDIVEKEQREREAAYLEPEAKGHHRRDFNSPYFPAHAVECHRSFGADRASAADDLSPAAHYRDTCSVLDRQAFLYRRGRCCETQDN